MPRCSRRISSDASSISPGSLCRCSNGAGPQSMTNCRRHCRSGPRHAARQSPISERRYGQPHHERAEKAESAASSSTPSVKRLGAKSHGIAPYAGEPVFLPFAIRGDRVLARLGSRRGPGREGRAFEHLVSGPGRAVPVLASACAAIAFSNGVGPRAPPQYRCTDRPLKETLWGHQLNRCGKLLPVSL
jgi:hypothetical protein